jgi:hypothetical protein
MALGLFSLHQQITVTEALSIEGYRIVREIASVRYPADPGRTDGRPQFSPAPPGFRAPGAPPPRWLTSSLPTPNANVPGGLWLGKAGRVRLGGALEIPDAAERKAAEDAMRRYAASHDGNAVVDFHWQKETVRTQMTSPGPVVRKPFSDSADPRNYVPSFDRFIQTPPVTRPIDRMRYVFFGNIVKVEKISPNIA